MISHIVSLGSTTIAENVNFPIENKSFIVLLAISSPQMQII